MSPPRPRSPLRLAAEAASSLILLGSLALAGAVAAVVALVLAKSVAGALSVVARGGRLRPF